MGPWRRIWIDSIKSFFYFDNFTMHIEASIVTPLAVFQNGIKTKILFYILFYFYLEFLLLSWISTIEIINVLNVNYRKHQMGQSSVRFFVSVLGCTVFEYDNFLVSESLWKKLLGRYTIETICNIEWKNFRYFSSSILHCVWVFSNRTIWSIFVLKFCYWKYLVGSSIFQF